jgi:hypothetical protein
MEQREVNIHHAQILDSEMLSITRGGGETRMRARQKLKKKIELGTGRRGLMKKKKKKASRLTCPGLHGLVNQIIGKGAGPRTVVESASREKKRHPKVKSLSVAPDETILVSVQTRIMYAKNLP